MLVLLNTLFIFSLAFTQADFDTSKEILLNEEHLPPGETNNFDSTTLWPD